MLSFSSIMKISKTVLLRPWTAALHICKENVGWNVYKMWRIYEGYIHFYRCRDDKGWYVSYGLVIDKKGFYVCTVAYYLNLKYSITPVTRTLKRNQEQFELSGWISVKFWSRGGKFSSGSGEFELSEFELSRF